MLSAQPPYKAAYQGLPNLFNGLCATIRTCGFTDTAASPFSPAPKLGYFPSLRPQTEVRRSTGDSPFFDLPLL